jgi:hypothetical protein
LFGILEGVVVYKLDVEGSEVVGVGLGAKRVVASQSVDLKIRKVDIGCVIMDEGESGYTTADYRLVSFR